MAAIVVVVSPSPALAYWGNGAASYADTWAHGRNSNYMSLSQDCANFVSQALHSGGGFSYVGGSSETDDTQWWAHWNSTWGYFTWSYSFTVADDFYTFLMLHYPGGWNKGTAHTLAQQEATYTPDSVVTGDVIFYDFNSNGAMDHVAIQVGWGMDLVDPNSSGWYGNYVDQHTTDRKHAFWSLLPYNASWATTTITFVHVDANNN